MKYLLSRFSFQKNVLSMVLMLSILFVGWSVFPINAIAVTYEDAIQKGRVLADEGKFDEAQRIVSSAVKQNNKRWEAYALLGLIYHSQGDNTKAVASVDKALLRAPEDKKATLLDMKKRFSQAKSPSTSARKNDLSSEGSRKLETLNLILKDVDRASSKKERIRLLREFWAKSADFLYENPNQPRIWTMRAAAAVELDYPRSGQLAGRQMKNLGLSDSLDPTIRKIMTELERKGWFAKQEVPGRSFKQWSGSQIRAAAEEADEEAQFRMGGAYFDGLYGLPQNIIEACKWFRKASEQGHPTALYVLALIVSNGDDRGVIQDKTEAFRLYRRGAVLGSAECQYNLGWMYRKGVVVPKDDAEAERWIRKAAENGYTGEKD